MSPLQMKPLTIVTKVGAVDEKPAKSPTESIDSGVGFDSPIRASRPMTTRDLAYTPTEGRASSDRVIDSPITVIVNGIPYPPAQLEAMGRDLAAARENGEFPRTTTPNYVVQATVDDHTRLLRLREVRGDAPRAEWSRMRDATELLVRFTREIRQRDGIRGEQTETANVQARVANMMRGLHGETNLYRLVQHAVHHAIKGGNAQQTSDAAGVDIAGVLQSVHDRIASMADRTSHGIDKVNMEAVLEQVFGMIEHSLLDATGPLRLNASRMDNTADRMDIINNAHQAHVNAIGQHVNAIGGHVGALSSNINSLNGNVNSVAGNVQAMTTQVGLLQTIINMIPEMVAQAVKDILPRAVQDAIVPIIVARLQERASIVKGGLSTKGAEFNEKAYGPEKSSGKQEKKPGFFKRLFGGSKRGGHDDDAATGGASGVCY